MPNGRYGTLTTNVLAVFYMPERNISMLVSSLCYCTCRFLCWQSTMGDTFKDTKHSEYQKVMRGELRGEILVCGKLSGRALMQMQQGTVTGEGKV